MSNIIEILKIYFGIATADICEVQGGWSAKAYQIDAGDRNYFLKVYDKSLPSIQPWINRIDTYMPVLGWLSGTSELRRNVIHPITTLDGKYMVETTDCVYVLFDYIHGETPVSPP